MEQFAQTGAQQDDLFDDIQYAPGGEESMQTRAPDDLFGEDFTPIAEPVVEQQQQQQQQQQQPQAAPTAPKVPTAPRGRGGRGRGEGNGRGRGEGRGGRGDGRGGRGEGRGGRAREAREHQKPREAAASSTDQATSTVTTDDIQPATASSGALSDSRFAPQSESKTDTKPEAKPEAKPSSNTARGDRRATGGLQKPKLTADELEAKMKTMSLRSVELTERHKRAEADRASFDKREEVAKEVAKQKSKEERRDRQQMMGEREKNRQRKLKAMEGREWDAEKQEEDYSPRARGAFGGRGAHGGIAGQRDAGGASAFGRDQEDYTDGREYLYNENRGRGRGRGSGPGRGGRGGRAGHEGRQQSAPKHSDFPELPAAPKPSADKPASDQPPALEFPKKVTDAPLSDLPVPEPAGKGERWADMLDDSTAT